MIRAAALAVTALAVLGAVPPALAGDADQPCAAMGTAEAAGQQVPSCEKFYGSGAAIRVPADTSRVVYGVLNGSTLQTRSGDLPVAGSAWTPYQDAFGLLLRARVAQGKAVDPKPVVLVSQRAVLAPFATLQSSATVAWMSPPSGVSDAPALLRFDSRTSATIVNYAHGVRVGGRCLPALAGTAAEKSVYRPFFGSGALTVYWTPGMHAPPDSEIVLDSPTGPSWMSPGPQVVGLLEGPWSPTRVSFTIHANPIGTPATISGALGPGTSPPRC